MQLFAGYGRSGMVLKLAAVVLSGCECFQEVEATLSGLFGIMILLINTGNASVVFFFSPLKNAE